MARWLALYADRDGVPRWLAIVLRRIMCGAVGGVWLVVLVLVAELWPCPWPWPKRADVGVAAALEDVGDVGRGNVDAGYKCGG